MNIEGRINQPASRNPGTVDNAPGRLLNYIELDALSHRAITVSTEGEALVRLSSQTREAVSAAEGAINAVRRRSDETGELEQTGDAAGVVIRSRRVGF